VAADRPVHRDPEPDRWPLVTGSLAAAAHLAIVDIAADLTLLAGENRLDGPTDTAPVSPLASGSAGVALFFAYAHQLWADRGWDDLAMDLVGRAMESAAAHPFGLSLFSGASGVGWVLSHLEGRLFEVDDDPGEEVETALLAALASSVVRWPFELIAGLAGLGVYFLERLPWPGARQGAERVIERLAESAERSGDRATWFTPPHALPNDQRRAAPHGYYNLGISHGVPGVIGFLGAAAGSGLAVPQAEDLASATVSWLLAQRLPNGSPSAFPGWVGAGIPPAASRLAWCYGDLGIAAVLLTAARAFGRADWEGEARATARQAAARTEASSGVVDAGLCHGAAGVGHVFHRLYRATGDEALGQAAVFWLGKALDLRQPGSGPGGYRSADVDSAGRRLWNRDAGFLTGAAGVGLALVAALSEVEPEWDRLLLLPSAT
jgi:lantibiotic modifying enzyme